MKAPLDDKKESKAAGERPSHYIGIGASAGGLEAIEALFNHMPPHSGMAFIVIQHLSPDYKSLMVELLSKRTDMQVFRAEEGMRVEPNCIYLIPPKKNLTIFHGKLLLSEQDYSRGINLPIDIFLRSLADDQGEKAIAIILSGTGSDGMRGIRSIKESGGMVMVQDEDSAKFDGMPRSAISTGLADFILPPVEMPAQLLSYSEHPYVAKSEGTEQLLTDEDGLTRIFALLREKTKVDFTFYKPSTVVRRIERRMTVNQIHDLRDYVRHLESFPREQTTLYRELLIGVTSFFRDPKVFKTLSEKWLKNLINENRNRELRFWVAGCSTGEEAYSLAILSKECMETLGLSVDVKIFATDIDRDAILFAGNGEYPESIAADVSRHLLSKYFYHRDEYFQINRTIREMVVFAQHNLIKDPPFTNIDLISCRNLLIYLQPVLQKKVLEHFNFSLNPGGVLLLGTSETTGDLSDFFEPLNHKCKVYRSRGKRKPAGSPSDPITSFYLQGPVGAPRSSGWRRIHRQQEEDRIYERLINAFAEEYGPLTVVINDQMEIVHVVGDAEGYFKLPSGKMHYDITKMAVKDLAIPLATGVQKVFKKNEAVKFTNIRLDQNGSSKSIQMKIKPLPPIKGREAMAVIFVDDVLDQPESSKSIDGSSYDIGKEAVQRINDLEQELQFTRENLQATIEELETANEELQATNEELLASNEELQSTNEELQSVNEELYTVNAEYQRKIMELTELNNDMDNLLSVTRIGTLFLDENLEVRKFTPEISEIFQIMPNDFGRPIHLLAHKIKDIDPVAEIKAVQETEKPVEKEIETSNGDWYLMRILPYQIGPGAFSGVVVNFVGIGVLKKTQEALQRERDLVSRITETSPAGITVVDRTGRIIYANAYAEKTLGLKRDQTTRRNNSQNEWKVTDHDGIPILDEELPFNRVMQSGRPVRDVRHAIETADGKRALLSINSAPLFDDRGQIDGVVSTVENITDRVRMDELHANVNSLLEVHTEPVVVTDLQGRVELANQKALSQMNCQLDEIKSESIHDCLQSRIGAELKQRIAEVIQSDRPVSFDNSTPERPIGIYPLYDDSKNISKIALVNIELQPTGFERK